MSKKGADSILDLVKKDKATLDFKDLHWNGTFREYLDVVDKLLNKGVMATGDVTLGVAGVDLIYLRLSALLCAADRIFPAAPIRPRRRSRAGGPLVRGRRK